MLCSPTNRAVSAPTSASSPPRTASSPAKRRVLPRVLTADITNRTGTTVCSTGANQVHGSITPLRLVAAARTAAPTAGVTAQCVQTGRGAGRAAASGRGAATGRSRVAVTGNLLGGGRAGTGAAGGRRRWPREAQTAGRSALGEAAAACHPAAQGPQAGLRRRTGGRRREGPGRRSRTRRPGRGTRPPRGSAAPGRRSGARGGGWRRACRAGRRRTPALGPRRQSHRAAGRCGAGPPCRRGPPRCFRCAAPSRGAGPRAARPSAIAARAPGPWYSSSPGNGAEGDRSRAGEPRWSRKRRA
jgi:hypothetical protein